CGVTPKRLYLLPRRGGILEALRQQRLRAAVASVPRGKQLRGVVEVLVGKWANLDVRHPAPDDSCLLHRGQA
ncbi:MAG: hypothetical protein ACJ74B_00115, partial [Gaiellaceae bacterium]